MILGALIDLGVDTQMFRDELSKLNLAGYKIAIGKTSKSGISATDVTVILEPSNHHTHRKLSDILKIVEESSLTPSVKSFSKEVFMEIAKAESKVHGININDVHFNEVGAIDSIVDIVGAAILIDMLKVEKVFSSELHDGSGFVNCQHGEIPVPVPAVIQMLCDSKIPLVSDNSVTTELVTPTGMAILKCLNPEFVGTPSLSWKKTGYGAGKREINRPNLLRVMLGETQLELNPIVVLETNIDDMTPEFMGYTMEILFDNGALDVYYTPVCMKKNRPASLLSVVADPKDEYLLTQIIFRETSTLGIRRSILQRHIMSRQIRTLKTEFGDVVVKVGSLGDIQKMSPEYESCKKIAKENGLPLSQVYAAAEREFTREEFKHNEV